MTKLTHPQMGRGVSKSTPTQHTATKNFVVDDFSDSALEEYEQNTQENEEPRQPQPEPVKEELTEDQKAKRALLEDLLFNGKMNKELEILGKKYTIKTLTSEEHNSMMRKLMSIGEAADLLTVRNVTLAVALEKIGDYSLDYFVDEVAKKDAFDQKIDIISKMQLGVVERLWKEYNKLLAENGELVSGEELKKS